MADLAAKKSNHISKVINHVTTLLDTVKELKDLRDEYQEITLVDDDFVGSNVHVDTTIMAQIMTALGTLHTSASASVGGVPSLYTILRKAKP